MIQYLLYKLAMWLVLRQPLKLSYAMASSIALLQYSFCRRDRLVVINNLKVILGTDDEKIIVPHAKKVFINFAKYLVDFLRFSVFDKEYVAKFIKIEGSQNLDEGFKRGKGVIALTGHMGNWELAGAVTALLGYPVNAVALSHKHKKVTELFIKQREKTGVRVIPLGVAVRKCFTALWNNELIGLLGDRDFTGSGIVVEFLGKQVRMPKGPAMFALKTGAAIIPTFIIRQPDDSYKMFYEKPIEYTPTKNNDEDMKVLTKKIVTVIENIIRRYPEQWFMFREFWSEDANKV